MPQSGGCPLFSLVVGDVVAVAAPSSGGQWDFSDSANSGQFLTVGF
jgi:hypothetical protein